MRLVVHGPSLGRGLERMRLAAAGLWLRGHEVFWLGPAPRGHDDPRPRELGGLLGLTRLRADVVLGGGGRPVPAALAAWVAGARCMVLALGPGALPRWSFLDRWCLGSLPSSAVLEDADPSRSGYPGLEGERVLGWARGPAPSEPDPTHPDTEILERACEALIARAAGPAPRAAVFLDRDGTLVVEKGYLARPADLELIPGVPPALRALKAAGYALVVISNQSGVGRGLFPLSSVHQAMARLRSLLRERGVELDGVYFCPHRPDEGCACRKPGKELLARAARDLNLSLRHSVMIGDKLLDVATGHNAGALGLLVRTGYGSDEERRLPSPDLARPPDQVFDHLEGAARWLLDHEGQPARD